MGYITWTKLKQKVPGVVRKVCLAYRSFVEVKIVKIAKNDEKRRKTGVWQDE